MRDLGHLEELSSTAALGLWADDVVIALDRAVSGAATAADREILRDAAATLKAAVQRTEHPLDPPRSGHSLAATDSALTVAATLVQGRQADGVRQILESTAEILDRASAEPPKPQNSEQIGQAIDLFGLLGERQLAASNSVLTSWKEARAWTGAPAISSFF